MYDNDNPPPVPLPIVWEQHFGLIKLNNDKKQAYHAIAEFMSKLGTYHVTARVPSNDPNKSVYIAQLEDGAGHKAWVVWDSIEAGTGYHWKLPPNTNCTGMLGEGCSVSNGELAVSPIPVYVLPRS